VAEPWDVVIVGAGPAGSSAALAVLAQRPQARVALVDAAAFPRDKACGDGLAPQAVTLLSMLGVRDVTAGYQPVDRLRLRTPLGADVLCVPPHPAHVVPRAVLDERIRRAALDAGAVPMQRRIREMTLRPGHVELGEGLAGRVVVAADGANSTLRRALGLAGNPPAHLAIAVRGYADAPAGVPEQLIDTVADGWPAYAWSFPVGDGSANIGFGKLRSRMSGPGREELYEPLAALLPGQPARADTLRAHHLPLSTWRPRQPDGRVLLVGDAASLINPLTGEGIYYAVLSGMLAGWSVVAAWDTSGPDEGPGAGTGAQYRRLLRRELGLHLATTSMLSRLARSPEAFDAALRLAGRDETLMHRLVEIGLARGTLPPALLLRLLRAATREGLRAARPSARRPRRMAVAG